MTADKNVDEEESGVRRWWGRNHHYLTRELWLLYFTVAVTMVGSVLLIVAMSTDHWIMLSLPQGVFRPNTGGYTVSHHSGLWRICRTELFNNSHPHHTNTTCSMLKLFPDEATVKMDPEVDYAILNYSRSETAFAVISLLFAVIAHLFAFYALREPRYMFKRLTGILFLFTAVCTLVSVEVLMNSVNYERAHLKQRHPAGSMLTYGYSFVLCWFVFLVYLAAAIIFFVCSRKRKGDKARSMEEAIENEPIHLGRI